MTEQTAEVTAETGDETFVLEQADTEIEEIVEEEPAEDQPEAHKEEDKRKTLVPHAALHEARQLNKELRAQMEEQKRQNEEAQRRTEERLMKLYQIMQGGQEEYVDPLDQTQNKVKQLEEKLNARETEEVKRIQEMQDRQQFVSKYQESMAAYAKDNPEMDVTNPNSAYSWLVNNRRMELESTGLRGEELFQALHNDERAIVERAWREGRNPGEVLYELAKMRGYKSNTQANKIDQLNKGLQASKSLGAGGVPDKGIFDIDKLMKLSDEEFFKEAAKIERSRRVSA